MVKAGPAERWLTGYLSSVICESTGGTRQLFLIQKNPPDVTFYCSSSSTGISSSSFLAAPSIFLTPFNPASFCYYSFNLSITSALHFPECYTHPYTFLFVIQFRGLIEGFVLQYITISVRFCDYVYRSQ